MVAIAVFLTGCAQLPRSGAIGVGPNVQIESTDDYLYYSPSLPSPGDSQQQIVTGFLSAGNGPQNDYEVARSYLANNFKSEWSASDEVLVQQGATVFDLIDESNARVELQVSATIDANGIDNLAPFSFFNVVSEDPPHIMFSTVRTGNKNKDTLNNILANQQFVVNLVTEDVVEQMNTTSQPVAADVNEFELANVTPIESIYIKPKRVKESLVQFECEMVHHYFIEKHQNGGACIIIGKIITMHIDDSILMENHKIDLEKYKPVARLAGSNYSKLGEIFSIKR